MSDREHETLPDDLRPAAAWLQAQKPEVSGHDLDRLRSRVRQQAAGGKHAPTAAARSRRPISTAIAVVALVGSLGGAFAIAGNGPPSSPGNSASSQGHSAADSQYRPGKGCGDKNHVHDGQAPPSHSHGGGQGTTTPSEADCKKPPN